MAEAISWGRNCWSRRVCMAGDQEGIWTAPVWQRSRRGHQKGICPILQGLHGFAGSLLTGDIKHGENHTQRKKIRLAPLHSPHPHSLFPYPDANAAGEQCLVFSRGILCISERNDAIPWPPCYSCANLLYTTLSSFDKTCHFSRISASRCRRAVLFNEEFLHIYCFFLWGGVCHNLL